MLLHVISIVNRPWLLRTGIGGGSSSFWVMSPALTAAATLSSNKAAHSCGVCMIQAHMTALAHFP